MTARALTILMYHSLDDSGSVVSVHPDLFASQMSALRDAGYRGVALREAVNHRKATGSWPERAAALTFDDGFANNHKHALPVLAQLGFSATVFLVTGHVGGKNDWALPPVPLGVQPLVTWSQARELSAAGWELGAHTRSHPRLSSLRSEEVLDEELDGSRRDIESAIGEPVTSFAYPYGTVSGAAARSVAGRFDAACTTVLKAASTCDPYHLLPRIDAYYLRHAGDVRGLLAGDWNSYLTLRRGLRRVRGWIVR